jgi:hypothetical protein
MASQFGEQDVPVDRRRRAFDRPQLTVRPTPRTGRPRGLLGDRRLKLSLLDLAAELLPQRVRPQLDDRVVGNPLDRALGLVQSHRDFRCLVEQTSESFLEFVSLPFHGNPRDQVRNGPPNHRGSRTLPQIPRVPLLTFLRRCWEAQKLTCTPGDPGP